MQLDGCVYDPLVPTPVFHERGVIDCEPAAPLFLAQIQNERLRFMTVYSHFATHTSTRFLDED